VSNHPSQKFPEGSRNKFCNFIQFSPRCLSVPVSIVAAIKHPERLLGTQAATALNMYHADIRAFNKELGTMSTATSQTTAESADTPFIGMKRKRTD